MRVPSALACAILICFSAGPGALSQRGGCHGDPYFNAPNLHPIGEATDHRQLLGSVQNGKIYKVDVPFSDNTNKVNTNASSWYTEVHVWGSAHAMGMAQGQLLKQFGPEGSNPVEFISAVWTYMESQIGSAISGFDLPIWLEKDIENLGLEAALDLTYLACLEFTPSHFWEEMRGLSDATGVDYTTLRNVHMIAGLTQGACSMAGCWGPALDPIKAKTGMLQLRALDWDMDGPFRNFPQITVYHPNAQSPGGHAFANIGMSGFIGGLTGVSEAQLGISEIGASFPDASFGSMSRLGLPFIFLLRDILQFDNVLEDAENRMINARRTCDLMLGVGDGKTNQMRGFEYSYSTLNIFTDTNLMPYNETWHPRIPGHVYWGMDWDCPAYNTVLSTQLKKFQGKLTPELAISQVTGVEASGDNHVAWYDLQNQQFWVSFAAQKNVGGPAQAYARPFTHVDANLLWAEQPPTLRR